MLKSILVVCLVAAGCSAAPSARSPRVRARLGGRIIGGQEVDISQVPWTAALVLTGYDQCGASILSARWILTAAHCLVYDESQYGARVGSSIRDSGGSVYDANAVVPHSSFSLDSFDWDIGVIELSAEIGFNDRVQPVSLPTSEPEVGTLVTVTGWGDLGNGSQPVKLNAVTVSIVDSASCAASYSSIDLPITERMLCAGVPEGGKDACGGDSGGPLVAADGDTQYGVVSWGYVCGYAEYPGVYANVPYFRSWISEQTGL